MYNFVNHTSVKLGKSDFWDWVEEFLSLSHEASNTWVKSILLLEESPVPSLLVDDWRMIRKELNQTHAIHTELYTNGKMAA